MKANTQPAPADPAQISANPDLDALAGAAAAVDAENIAPAPGAPDDQPIVPAGPNYEMEAAGIVGTFAALVKGYCPDTASIWTEGTCADVSAALAPTLEYYGWTMGAMPPWVITLVVAGPPLIETAKLVRARMDEKKAATAKDQPAERDAPAVEVGPEQLVHPQVKLYGRV